VYIVAIALMSSVSFLRKDVRLKVCELESPTGFKGNPDEAENSQNATVFKIRYAQDFATDKRQRHNQV